MDKNRNASDNPIERMRREKDEIINIVYVEHANKSEKELNDLYRHRGEAFLAQLGGVLALKIKDGYRTEAEARAYLEEASSRIKEAVKRRLDALE